VPSAVELNLHELRSEKQRRAEQQTFEEEAEALSGSLRSFVYACWPNVVPQVAVPTWHIDAICEHLEAAYRREIPRLLITIQPGALKSTLVSVMAPAWRWTHAPQERIVSASHADYLAARDTRKSRELIQRPWYQARWGNRFDLTHDENMRTRYSNTFGGHRIATHVGGGTGERGSVLILDDAHNAREVASESALREARDWWGDTWASRLNVSVADPGVKIVIGQRVHEEDVIGFILDGDPDGSRWVHLCLPARYESNHPHLTPKTQVLISGTELIGDQRSAEGELLAPNYMDESALFEAQSEMTEVTKAAQYQQRPAPREGALLKRQFWRYYPREQSYYAEHGRFDQGVARGLGQFSSIVNSWDTSLKDRDHSDFVAGTSWGVRGADRYLLRIVHGRMGFNATVEAMLALYEWSVEVWPSIPQYVLVETASNGPDAIAEIERRINGVVKVAAKGSKEMRAEAASTALEGGNCFLPGFPNPDLSNYDPRTPTEVQQFVEEAATFPMGAHDDQVDSWSQAMNWLRQRGVRKASFSAPSGRI
jgi:predicted phage terminase large subunit-like protein